MVRLEKCYVYNIFRFYKVFYEVLCDIFLKLVDLQLLNGYYWFLKKFLGVGYQYFVFGFDLVYFGLSVQIIMLIVCIFGLLIIRNWRESECLMIN